MQLVDCSKSFFMVSSLKSVHLNYKATLKMNTCLQIHSKHQTPSFVFYSFKLLFIRVKDITLIEICRGLEELDEE